MIISAGPTQPKKTASKWKTIIRPNTQNYKLEFAAGNLFKIRHWKIRQECYSKMQNDTATWFIDPPYQFGGEWYVYGNQYINYSELARWCKQRNGQVIVCENTKADWLPFDALKEMWGSKYKTTEAIWSNEPIMIQSKLFEIPDK